MNKEFFVKDSVSRCADCEYHYKTQYSFKHEATRTPKDAYHYYCRISKCDDVIEDKNSKPNWCPFHSMPERRENVTAAGCATGSPLTEDLKEQLIAFGFNECLDKILNVAERDE